MTTRSNPFLGVITTCFDIGTSIKAVSTSTKYPPNEGKCALAHRADTGTAHVYSHDRAGTPHRAPRSVRMWFTVWVRYVRYAFDSAIPNYKPMFMKNAIKTGATGTRIVAPNIYILS